MNSNKLINGLLTAPSTLSQSRQDAREKTLRVGRARTALIETVRKLRGRGKGLDHSILCALDELDAAEEAERKP